MHALGVCSWSLRCDGPGQLVERVRACGLSAVQLALDPIRDGRWDEQATREALSAAGIEVLSGMMGTAGEDYSTLDTIRQTGGVRADANWPKNLAAAGENAKIARRWGLPLVTLHAGFLPHDGADPLRGVMIDRLRQVLKEFAHEGVQVAFETGQEDAATLLEVLGELDAVCPRGFAPGVNFDPANMILYAMGDPVESLRALAPFVRQVHIKDAVPTAVPGTWGREVAVGNGAVRWAELVACIEELLPRVPLAIEREAGNERIDDIRAAAATLERLMPGHVRARKEGA